MTSPSDAGYWDERWSQVLRDHGDQVAKRPPNAHLLALVADRPPGVAVDAGCGHGAETMWLAARGWQVTAVDFSAAALAHARSTVDALGGDIAERVDWVEADLSTWVPVADAVAALDPGSWELAVAEDRPRADAGSGVDAVICARRR